VTSLLHGVAARVATIGADLPLAEVGAAAERIRDATALLAATLEASTAPPPTPLLVAATDHLDAAAGALARAREELDRYLAQVGITGSSPAPVSSGPSPTAWADRVDALTDHVGRPRPPVHSGLSIDELLTSVVRAVGDRTALRRALAAAPPAVGWALSARCAGSLAPEDPARVRRCATSRLPALLPGLDAATAEQVVSAASRVAPPPAGSRPDPTDVAIATIVLLAASTVDRPASPPATTRLDGSPDNAGAGSESGNHSPPSIPASGHTRAGGPTSGPASGHTRTSSPASGPAGGHTRTSSPASGPAGGHTRTSSPASGPAGSHTRTSSPASGPAGGHARTGGPAATGGRAGSHGSGRTHSPAEVGGRAAAHGSARIHGRAGVGGRAEVRGSAWVSGPAPDGGGFTASVGGWG